MPSFLNSGDQIEIVAPARFIDKSDLFYAKEIIKRNGFRVKINDRLYKRQNIFAGSNENRILGLESALNDSQTKAIFFARGGYGCIQLIDSINFKIFLEKPKWLIGFSDATTILIHIYVKHKVSSIHGSMPYNFKNTKQKSIDMIFDLLRGDKEKIKISNNNLNVYGSCSGVLIGGNLSILCSMIGSSSFLLLKKQYILFIEDIDEYRYQIERMMYILDRAGVLKNLKGLIVGQMTNILDNEISFGKTTHQIIRDIVSKYNYPIAFDFPIGHSNTNHPLVIGAKIHLDVNTEFSEISYEK
jgi:muramoyltetrapeptide carboxypeptidase